MHKSPVCVRPLDEERPAFDDDQLARRRMRFTFTPYPYPILTPSFPNYDSTIGARETDTCRTVDLDLI